MKQSGFVGALGKAVPFLWAALLVLLSWKYAHKLGDFDVFLKAGELLRTGENPYGKWIFLSEGNYFLYFYSPLWASIVGPFAAWATSAKFVWLLLNGAMLFHIYYLVKERLFAMSFSVKNVNALFALTLLLAHRFLLYNFMMAQMTIFVLWSVLFALHLQRANRLKSAALLLAFSINVKILAVVLLPYFIVKRQWKMLGWSLVFWSVLLFLPAMWLGWLWNSELLNGWWSVINPSNGEHLVETQLGPHSLTALIPTLLSATEGDFEVPRNILSLTATEVLWVLNGVRLLLVVSVLFVIRRNRGLAHSQLIHWRDVSYLLLLIPLIFPHQQKYAFLLVAPAQLFALLWIHQQEGKGKKLGLVLLSLSFVLMSLTSDLFIGKHLFQLAQYYKLITYGALLLLPFYFLVSNKEARIK